MGITIHLGRGAVLRSRPPDRSDAFPSAARDEVLRSPASAGAEPIAEPLRLRLLTHVPLGPFDAAAIAGSAMNQLGGAVSPRLVNFLEAHREGNPFFAEGILSECWEHDLLVERGDGWDLAGEPDFEGFPLRLSLRLAIDVRIDQLPEAADLARVAGAPSGASLPHGSGRDARDRHRRRHAQRRSRAS